MEKKRIRKTLSLPTEFAAHEPQTFEINTFDFIVDTAESAIEDRFELLNYIIYAEFSLLDQTF